MESRGQICGMSSPLSPHRTRQSAARVGREQRKEIAQHASALSAQARDKLGTPVTPMDRQFASLGKILGKISPLASPRAPQRGSLDTSHVDSGKSVGGTCRAAQPHHRAEKGGAGEGATPAKQRTKGGDISWKERHGGANGRGICGRGGLHGGMQEWGSVLLANGGIGEGGGSQAGSLSARRSVGAGIGNIEALPLSPKLLQAVNSPRQALAHPSPKALRMTPRFGVGMTDAKDLRDLRMDFSPQVCPCPATTAKAGICTRASIRVCLLLLASLRQSVSVFAAHMPLSICTHGGRAHGSAGAETCVTTCVTTADKLTRVDRTTGCQGVGIAPLCSTHRLCWSVGQKSSIDGHIRSHERT
jgi:hypothetical protein